MKQSKTVQQIQEVDKIEQVGELAARGMQPTQIANELGISRMEVTRRMDKWLQEHSLRLQEQAEVTHLIENARLDYIYAAVAPYALPRYDEALKMQLPPDPKMLDVLVKVIKEKREWVKMANAKPAENRVNIEHIEVTIAQSNPLYDIAQANMETSFLGFADYDISDIYKPDPDTDPAKMLEAQTAELAQYVDITDNDQDEES